jgi:hypothetical protein
MKKNKFFSTKKISEKFSGARKQSVFLVLNSQGDLK